MPTAAALDIRFTSDTRNAEAGMDRLNNKVRGLDGSFKKTIGSVAGGMILGNIVQGMARSVGGLVQGALDFEASMANVNSIAQLTGGEIDILAGKVNDLSGKTAQAPQTLADGLYQIYSSGFKGAEALDILEASANAATAGLTTTDVAASAVTAVLNAYTNEVYTAAQVSDVLFQIVNDGVITFDQIANNMGNTLPIANALGISVYELGAAYAQMTLQGVNASAAETQIASLMKSAANPTDSLTEATKAYGYETTQALLAAEGMPGLLKAIDLAAGGDSAALYDLLGTQEAVNAATILGTDGAKAYLAEVEKMKHASDGLGATNKALAKQMESASFRIKQAKIAVQQAATVLIGAFAPAIAAVARGLTWMVLKGILPVTKGIADFIGALTGGAGLGNALRAIANDNTPGFIVQMAKVGDVIDRVISIGRDFIGFLKDVFGSATSVNSILDKLFGNNSAMYAGLGPGGLVDSGGGRLKELVQSMLLLADSAGHIFRAFQEGGVSGALDEFGNQWDRIKGEIADIGNVVIDVAVDAVVNIASWAWSAPPDVWAWVNAQLNGGSGDGNAAGINAGIGGSATGTTASVTLTDVGVNIASWAWGEVEDLWGWIEGELGVTSGGGGGVAMGGRAPGQSTPAMGGSAPVTLSDVGVNIASWAINQLEELGLAVKDKVTEWWPTVKDAIGNTWDAALEIGEWLITGGSNLFTAVSDKIEEWWPTVKDSIGNAWDATLEIGTWLIEGGSNLFTAVSDKLKEWWPIVQDSIGSAWDATLEIGTWLIEGGSALFTAVSDKIEEWWPIVQNGIGNAWNLTVEIGNWLIESSKPIWDSIKEFVTGAGGGGTGAGIGAGIGGNVVGLPAVVVNIENWVMGTADNIWAWLRGVLDSGSGTGAGISAGIGGQGGVDLSGVPVNISSWTVGDTTSVFEAIGDKINVDLVSGDPFAVEKAHARGEEIGAEFGEKLWEGFVAGITGSGAGAGGQDQTFWQDMTSFDPPADPLPGVDFLDRWVATGQSIATAALGAIWDGFTSTLSGGGADQPGAAIPILGDLIPKTDPGAITQWVTDNFTQPIKDALDVDLSDIPLPELPSWVKTPADFLQDATDFIAAVGAIVATLGPMWEGIKAALTFDLSVITEPSLPDWFDTFLDPVNTLIGAITTAAEELVAAKNALKAAIGMDVGTGLSGGETGGAGGGTGAGFGGTSTSNIGVSDVQSAIGGGGGKLIAQAPMPVNFYAVWDDTGVPASVQGIVKGAPPTLPPMKATLGLDIQQAGSDMAKAMQWGLDWDSRTFIADFNSDINQTGLAVANVMQWGLDWDSRVFVADFNADISQAGNAVATAMQWGLDWDGRVFTASFNVDTSGITNAVAVAAQAAADIDALMPHSPAKKGPLSRTPNFSYITDSLVAAMSNMGPAAERGMGDVADRLGRWSKVSTDLAGGSGALGKWRYADGSGPGRKGDTHYGGPTININAPVYGVEDLENKIVDTYTDKIIPAHEISMRRHDRSWGLSS